MHADEAVLADKFGQLLAKGRFQYDSADYHGPVLEYLTLLPAAAKGEWTYASLDEWTLRLVPALAGIALALSPMLLRKFIGNSAASAAGLLIATSTPLVYYSRDYIPEMLLALFTAIFVALFLHSRWISAGLVAGLAAATKETAVLAIGASLIAFCWERWPGWKPLILFTVTAAIITVAILGPANILPATHAYLLRAAGAEWHIHAWSYYLQLISFGTPFILVFAAIGAPAHRRFAVFTVLLIAVYSVIPYKTPWCVVTMVWALSIMAGLGFRELSLQMFFVATAAIVLVCIVSSWQAWNASTARAADPSNRWVYAQTTPDVYEIVVQIGQFAPDRNDRISVYSTQNLWPLPWYLRQYSNVQWSRDVDSRANPAAIVIVTPELEGKLATRLYTARLPGQRELYVPILPGTTLLRPGVEVRVYVAKSLYDQRAR
jgi:predicted membrane-bound mannosyltransferase